MTNNITSIFKYLKKENISIDEEEFSFQIKSHPDYPSLLAFSDALSFFNISNAAMHVDVSEIELLPERFVCLLNMKGQIKELYFVEKIKDEYICSKDNNTYSLSVQKIEEVWGDIVLLVEKPETESYEKPKKLKIVWLLVILCLGLFFSTLSMLNINFLTKIFFVFPFVGFLFSVAALKDLFGAKNELLNNFCNITASTSCSSIVDSEKWKILKQISFSDLSILFFASQFFTLLMLSFSENSALFFSIQKPLLLCGLPVILVSLYYQKYVEEKWCPICLLIITTIVSELIYVEFMPTSQFSFSALPLTIFVLVHAFVALTWFALKKTLALQKELKESQIVGIRFARNYEVFRKVLLSEEKQELAFSPIILGNKESSTEISIVTSPFCGHCKDAHEILERILHGNRDDIKVKVLINADIDSLDDEKKTFFRTLQSIYAEEGETRFVEALNYWFHNKDLKKWISIYSSDLKNEEMDSIYKIQNEWCIANDSFMTPSIFINGYKYPKMYDRKNLEFFVQELIEEDSF